MRIAAIVFVFLAFTLDANATNSAYDQLEEIYLSARQDVPPQSLPSNTALFYRGDCYFQETASQPPSPHPIVLVLATTDYPPNGPVQGKRIARAYATEGSKSDSEALNELGNHVANDNDFGFMRKHYDVGGSYPGFSVAANLALCEQDPHGQRCDAGYIKQDDDYIYLAAGYTWISHHISYANRLFCYLKKNP
ncbi:MAG TPA: hypothetical protein VM432_14745 [Bdellovibrionales bacterium]|nr:hypothetical protein [Bdellovibrionales bacterium]